MKEMDKRKEEHVREWDMGKEDIQKERSRSRDRIRSNKKRHSKHSPSPPEGKYYMIVT